MTERPQPLQSHKEPSLTSRALDYYIKLILVSAGGLITTGIASAAGLSDAITQPLAAIFALGCSHPALIAWYVSLHVTGDEHHWMIDGSAASHTLLWLMLAPYFAAMLFEAARRYNVFGSVTPMVYPLCASMPAFMVATWATYAKSTVFTVLTS